MDDTSGQKSSILIVDDEWDILTITTKGLEHAGYDVHAFDKPTSALEHAKECKECDVLISDIRMPGISGLELVKKVKKMRPDMKVILMTSFEIHKEEWEKALPSTEVDGLLKKPLKISDFVEAIKKMNDGNSNSG